MPMVNFNDIQAPVATPGWYLCSITTCRPTRAGSGSDMWELVCTVRDGDEAGKVVEDRVVFSGKSLVRVKELALAVGFDATGEREFTERDVVGKLVYIAQDWRWSDYHGDYRLEVPFRGGYRPERAGPGGPIDPAKPPPKRTPDRPSDDDVPF